MGASARAITKFSMDIFRLYKEPNIWSFHGSFLQILFTAEFFQEIFPLKNVVGVYYFILEIISSIRIE